jgi:predicted transposase YbfD/YdcC
MSKKKKSIKSRFTNLEKEVDMQKFQDTVISFFKDVPDPRSEDNCDYSLSQLLIIMLMAVFSGADDIADIEEYANQKWRLLQMLFGEDFIPPSYNTFWWLLTRMNPEAFSSAFYQWIKNEHISSLSGKQINIDGKCIRGARSRKGNRNVHIVHAWVHEQGMLIGQQLTDEKSNEITAIPALIQQIDVKDATISIDAAGCQKNIVEAIRKAEGNYLLAVKSNQPKLYDEVTNLFDQAHMVDFDYVMNCDRYECIEKTSGRIEKRGVAVISDMNYISTREEWRDIETVIEVINETTSKGKTSVEKRYFISNLIESAREFGARTRAHWSIESFHWVLDVVFKEDDCRANVLHGAVNLGTLRRAAINIVKSDQGLKKLGMAKLRRQAKWNEDGTVMKKILEAFMNVKSF